MPLPTQFQMLIMTAASVLLLLAGYSLPLFYGYLLFGFFLAAGVAAVFRLDKQEAKRRGLNIPDSYRANFETMPKTFVMITILCGPIMILVALAMGDDGS